MKKIGILTRDCAGINACIRAIVRTAAHYDIETIGFIRGYDGLMDGEFVPLNRRSVSGIINLGGTILKTARATRFLTTEGQKKAVETLTKNHVSGLIVVGGNGSLKGAHMLAKRYSVPVIGVPATIDNDISEVNQAIGADTAVNVAMDALDKIRDTATSLERIFVVEVMGRDSGYIAFQVALAGGCEEVLAPEQDFNYETICDEIRKGNAKGKKSWIIIVAEGKAKATNVANVITSLTGLETRVAILGHIQRGGRPTATDRILAAQLGSYAVELLKDGHSDECVRLHEGVLDSIPLSKAIKPGKMEFKNYYKLIKILT